MTSSSAGRRALRGPLLAALLCSAALVAPAAIADSHVTPAAVSPYNYAPASRTVKPVAIQGTSGAVGSPGNVLSGQSTRLSGANSAVVLDFGKEVGGLVTLSFAGASGASQQVGLAFSESSLYVGQNSDASSGAVFSSPSSDGAVYATVNGAGGYTMPTDKLRDRKSVV